MIDRKTRKPTNYLFQYRNELMGRNFLNESVIPLLCKLAGVSQTDVAGRITSHRARATTATWMHKMGMAPADIGKLLGHTDPLRSLPWYLREDKHRLGRAYRKANPLERYVAAILDTNAHARQAMLAGLPGVTGITVDRLLSVSRGAIKGQREATQRYIEQRALTSEQYTYLYAMMAEEWQRYLDDGGKKPWKVNLPGLVACWLAFNDGIRPAEINCLAVDDILVDNLYGKHGIRVHAPNKQPDVVPIEKDTLLLLQAMVDEGKEVRAVLKTDLLFVSGWPRPRLLHSKILSEALRAMIRRHRYQSLPPDLKLSDGRTTLGTHLARTIQNRERVRRLMRHAWASTTEIYYRARQKLVVAGNMAKALRAEAWRLTIACQRPVLDIAERPDQVEILRRNPGNAALEWGSCGLDVVRQGSCRRAKHCFECPLLVPWVSKRHNYVAERDEYLHMAENAENLRDRKNLLYHANLAEAHIALIDRRREEKMNNAATGTTTRQRRPRRTRGSS